MILVTCGSSGLPFDRLVGAVAGLGDDESLVVQHGPSTVRVAGARNVDFLPMDELTELVREARVVVCHAGVGSILLALGHGTQPVVVPRRRSLGEAVDDHQVECARRFARAGLVEVADDSGEIQAAIAGARAGSLAPDTRERPLVDELRSYVEAAVSR